MKRHALLISIDDLRADAIAAEPDRPYLNRLGLEEIARTPTLDRLLREGFSFAGCRVTAPLTPPSHATMLTGHLPPRHGVRRMLDRGLSPGSPTLFERLAPQGFTCVSQADYSSIFTFNGLLRGSREIPVDDERFVAAFAKVAAEGGRFFGFAHFGNVHSPYGLWKKGADRESERSFLELHRRAADRVDPKAPLSDPSFSLVYHQGAQKFRNAPALLPLYLAGVTRFDRGRFAAFIRALEKRGLLRETLLVVTADHGESNLHGLYASELDVGQYFGHGSAVCEEQLRVPLIFWTAPAAHKGESRIRPGRWPGDISSADIAPTLLGALGCRVPRGEFDGVDRSALLTTAPDRAQSAARRPSESYAETWFHGDRFWKAFQDETLPAAARTEGAYLMQQSIRCGPWKVVVRTAPEKPGRADWLIRLDRDPGEHTDLLEFVRFMPEALRGAPSKAATSRLFGKGMEDPREIYARLKGRIAEISELALERSDDGTAPAAVDTPELERNLRELGYLR